MDKIDLAVANGSSNNVSILINTSGGILPTVNVISSTSLICSGQSATLTISGANSYLWNTGATTSTLMVSPIATSVYSVIATRTGGCKIPSTITQSVSFCTGINSFAVNGDLQLNIYPNPTNEILTIELDASTALSITKNYKIEIVNIFGEVVLNQIASANNLSLNINNFKSGIYFIQLKINNSTVRKKIIKQ